MTLSVIMPTYNGSRFLGPQIDSILAQTDPDFELIAIDDGSTDDTVAILDDYARRDARVRRLPSTGNAGQRRRLIELVLAAAGEFVAFADQDDIWHPERNARLLHAIGDRAVAFGRSQLIDADGRDLGQSILDALDFDPTKPEVLSLLFHPLVSAHGAIVRRSWLDIGVFSGPNPFDHVFGLEALLSTGLAYDDDAVVFHRMHDANQMNGGTLNKIPVKLFSRHRLRTSTSFVRSSRLYFFQMLDQLSRSAAIDADVRRDFKQALDACRYAWYQPLSFGLGTGRRLERDLHRLLGHYAASSDDLAYFTRRIRSITRAQASPVNIAGAFAQYRGGLP